MGSGPVGRRLLSVNQTSGKLPRQVGAASAHSVYLREGSAPRLPQKVGTAWWGTLVRCVPCAWNDWI